MSDLRTIIENDLFDPFRAREILLRQDNVTFLDTERPVVFISNGKVKRDAALAAGASVLTQEMLDAIGLNLPFQILMSELDKAERRSDADHHKSEEAAIISCHYDDAIRYAVEKAQAKAQAFTQLILSQGLSWFPAFSVFSDSTNIAVAKNGRSFIINKAGERVMDHKNFFDWLDDRARILVNTGLYVLPPNLMLEKGEAYDVNLELGLYDKKAAHLVLPRLLRENRDKFPAFTTVQALEHKIVRAGKHIKYTIQRFDPLSNEPPLLRSGELDSGIFKALLSRSKKDRQNLYHASFGSVTAALEIARVIPN